MIGYKYLRTLLVGGLALTLTTGCAVGHVKPIALGMLAGGLTGAVIGHELIRPGDQNQYRTQNTAISAIVVALATGFVMNWHYQALDEQMVEVSSRYSRYRLCNPDELTPDLGKQLGIGQDLGVVAGGQAVQQDQVGKLAISLDDSTKWAYPIFRKRFLPPERGETQVLSTRYIWEILRPGSFVTRSQDPQYFIEGKDK